MRASTVFSWGNALPLRERLESLTSQETSREVTDAALSRAGRRVARWRALFPFLGDDIVSLFQEVHAVDSDALLQVLGALSIAMPSASAPWVAEAAAACSEPIPPRNAAGGFASFLTLIDPLVERAGVRLEAALGAICTEHPTAPFTKESASRLGRAALPGFVTGVLNRALVVELNVARLRGALSGDTPQARFRSFCESLREPETARRILAEYPVLARLVVERIQVWVDVVSELFARLARDWESLQEEIGLGSDPGIVAHVHWHKGDEHRNGRHVAVVEFSSGACVVYKPKALSIDVHFQELLRWLNARGEHAALPVLKVVDRGEYGWVEFVAFRPCASRAEVERFYQRQGAYLAILHVLGATDVHLANLIASGEHPVLVDVETLFHPVADTVYPSTDPASGYLRTSVLRVGMLPHRNFGDDADDGVDLSGLGGLPGQRLPFQVPTWDGIGTDEMSVRDGDLETSASENRPTIGGEQIDILEFADSFVAGFSMMYRLLARSRDELTSAPGGPLLAFADDETRVVLRPTVTYASLRQASYHPDVLQDALDRDALLSSLAIGSKATPRARSILSAEYVDLQRGDIPMFVTRPSSTDLWTSVGDRIAGYASESALSHVKRRLLELTDSDLDQQVWVTRAALVSAASIEAVDRPRSHASILRPEDCRPSTILEMACKVGQELARRAIRDSDGAVSWLGVSLTAKESWSLRPIGAGLYDGVSGVALFLGYLATISGEQSFGELARGAVATLRRFVAGGHHMDLPVGVFDGGAGIAYAMSHLGYLWSDESLGADALAITHELSRRVPRDRFFDLISGSAGYLAAVVAIFRVTADERVLRAAVLAGDHLLEHATAAGNGRAWATPIPSSSPLTGFSHGASGIAWALLELSDVSGEDRFRAAALDGFAYERGCYSSLEQNWPDFRSATRRGNPEQRRFTAGWCHGAPGIVLARTRAARLLDAGALRTEIEAGLSTTLREGFGWSHCMCHGDFGNLDIALEAAESLDEARWRKEVRTVADGLMEVGATRGWRSDLPLGINSPGLMTGLAGVGLGLLRVAHRNQVPCVLALDPPPSLP